MKQIRLHGHLGKQFGTKFCLDVKTPAEAIRALCSILPDFEQHLIKNNEPGYKVFFSGHSIDEADLHLPRSAPVIRIVPVVAGASDGIGKILVGAALIGFSFYAPNLGFNVLGKAINLGSLAGRVGFSLVLGGISSALFSAPKADGLREKPDSLPSFIFDGPVNTQREGGAVPVGYGGLRVGGQIISAGLSTGDVPL